MAGDELGRRGWHLSNEGIETLQENGSKGVEQLIRTAIDSDLREIGSKWLPEELHKGKLDYIQGPAVLQLMKLRNISAPKENEESQAAPRLLRLSLTDGHMSCIAIEIENLKSINLGTPPGTKVLLEGAVDVENNLLLLTNKNFRCLGGRVEKLVETWDLKRKLAKQSRTGFQTEGGPPLFVPFGKKAPATASATKDLSQRDKKETFKSLDSGKKDKKEETEFEQQRQAVIAEALQEGKAKTFGGGGGKQPVSDRDVARIVEMGFTVDQATNALRQNSNVNDAISALISRGGDFRSGPRGGGRGGRGGGRGGDRFDRDREPREPRQGGRGRRGRDREEEGEESTHTRPSGPATLFDFLETKIPVKEESKPSSASSRPTPSQSNRQSHSDTSSSRGPQYTSASKPYQNGNSRQGQGQRPNHFNQSQQDSSGSNFQARKQQVPPRFAGKPEGQQSSSFHQQRPSSQRDYSNSFDSDSRTQRGGNSQRRSDNPSQDNRSNSNYQSRPKSASYNSGEKQDYHKENRFDSRQDSQYDGQQGRRYDNRYGNQQGKRQQDQRSYENRNQGSRPQDGPGKPYESRPAPEASHQWRRGDKCLAKYWEDGQYYTVRIEDFAQNGATCVVTFLDYGNMEEVLLSDVKPFQQQNWQHGNQRQYNKGPVQQLQQQQQQQQQQPFYHNPHQHPHPQGAPMMVHQPPPPLPRQEAYQGGGTINSMEFRRGGGKPRATQQFYNPPRQYQS